MKRITCIAISLAIAAGLCACGGAWDFSFDSPTEPPELELKIYTQSMEPAKAVRAEYYEIIGSVPLGWFSDLDTRMWHFYLNEFTIGNRYSEGVKLPPPVNPESRYETEAGYTIVGNYLSATRVLTEHRSGVEHPIVTFSAETWNMYGAVHAYWLWELLEDSAAWDAFDRAFAEGKCRLVYPEMDMPPGAIEALRESLADNAQGDRYFLTETGLGLYLNDRRHEEHYWLFEIAYEDLEGVRAALDEPSL